MPCRDYGPDTGRSYENPETQRRLDLATRVACNALRLLSKHNSYGSLSSESKVWWDRHQEEDARREAAENAKRERDKARIAALAKLSSAERKLLGL